MYPSAARALLDVVLEHRKLAALLRWRGLGRHAVGEGESGRGRGLSRVHCSVSQIGTSTGRLSCAGPNLQAAPHPFASVPVRLHSLQSELLADTLRPAPSPTNANANAHSDWSEDEDEALAGPCVVAGAAHAENGEVEEDGDDEDEDGEAGALAVW